MRECMVVKILREPKQDSLRMDHLTIEYWSVAVILKCEDGMYESNVTFESLEKAQKLEIGDVFLR